MSKIEVVCRRCGRKSPADEFKVDHVYKLAVCRNCYTEREKNLPKKQRDEKSFQENKKKIKDDSDDFTIKKSRIFDEDDAYLDKAVKRKEEEIKRQKENVVKTKKISENKVLYKCQNCNYEFKYNIQTQRPVVCPYCEAKVNHNIKF